MSRTKKEYANGQSRGGGKIPRKNRPKSYERTDKPIILLGRYPYGQNYR